MKRQRGLRGDELDSDVREEGGGHDSGGRNRSAI